MLDWFRAFFRAFFLGSDFAKAPVDVRIAVRRILDAEEKDGRAKIANQSYWHRVGYDVLGAAQLARAAVERTEPAETAEWLQRCLRAVAVASEQYRSYYDDEDGFGSATFAGIQRGIRALHESRFGPVPALDSAQGTIDHQTPAEPVAFSSDILPRGLAAILHLRGSANHSEVGRIMAAAVDQTGSFDALFRLEALGRLLMRQMKKPWPAGGEATGYTPAQAKILEMLDGRIGGRELLRSVVGNDHISAARYYTGMRELLNGGVEAGLELLRTAASMPSKTWETLLAEAELRKLPIRLPEGLYSEVVVDELTQTAFELVCLDRLGIEQAREAARQAKIIAERDLGNRHPLYAEACVAMGLCSRAEGDMETARKLYERALAIRIDTLGPRHLATSNSYHNLAILASFDGDYKRAGDLFRRALSIRNEVLGPSGSRTIETMIRLADIYRVTKDVTHLHDLIENIIEWSRVDSGAGIDPPFVNRCSMLASLCADIGSFDDALALHEAVALTDKRTLHDLFEQRNTVQRAELVESMRDRLDRYVEHVLDHHASQEEVVRRCFDITQKRTALVMEAQLPRDVDSPDMEAPAIEEIAAALPEDAALVQYILCQRSPQGDSLLSRRACCFVLTRHHLSLFDLGAADDIEFAVIGARSDMTGTDERLVMTVGGGGSMSVSAVAVENNDGNRGAQLRSLILDPINRALKNVKTVFIVPEGALWHVPFAALPDGDGYIGDNRDFVYLNSPRDLLRFSSDASGGRSLVIADPDFDVTVGDGDAERVLDLQRLSGTREEGAYIARCLGAQLWMDADASRERLQAHSSPRILHIASHGLFEGDAVTRGNPFGVENPLLSSSIALAGANRADVRGVLSAEDVLALELRGTELVVLSACDTGMGIQFASEGTFGLRWAFSAAGAQAQVVSLWKVPDAATCELMSVFYDQLLSGVPKVEALRKAQQEIRKKYVYTSYWAAFICHGNPGPVTVA